MLRMFAIIGSVVVLALRRAAASSWTAAGCCCCGIRANSSSSVGAAFGAFVTSNPLKVVKGAFAAAIGLLKGPRYRREDYVDLLKLLYDILVKIRKSGMLAIEADIEAPEKSKLFTDYPRILADHHMIEFITDCLRLIVGGNLDPHELESLLEYELETHHKEAAEPAHAVQRVADALPGFGIVAAVLGIVNTMAAIDGADTGTIGAQGRRGAGRHLPRHSGGLRLRRPDRLGDRASRARGGQGVRGGEDGAGGERARLCAAGRGGVRAQAAVVGRAAELLPIWRIISRARSKEATEGGRRGMSGAKSERPIDHQARQEAASTAHHGGAWKVAYADFVTAMMAFFMVMWLIASVIQGAARRDLRLLQEPQHGAGQVGRSPRPARWGRAAPAPA